MADEKGDYSSKPYGVAYKESRGGFAKKEENVASEAPPLIKPPSLPSPREIEEKAGGGSVKGGRTEILAGLAFIISLAALAFVLLSSGGMDASEKAELRAIAADLRAISAKDIVVSSPIQTTVKIDEEIPISEIFPSDFSVPLAFNLQLPKQVTAISSTGQAAVFTFDKTIPISQAARIDVSSSKDTIKINREIPVNTQVRVAVRVGDAYGSEFEDIIERMEKLGN